MQVDMYPGSLQSLCVPDSLVAEEVIASNLDHCVGTSASAKCDISKLLDV
jgi:hypothetical protein